MLTKPFQTDITNIAFLLSYLNVPKSPEFTRILGSIFRVIMNDNIQLSFRKQPIIYYKHLSVPSVRLPKNSGAVFSLQSQNCHPKSTLLACQSQAAFQKWVQKNFFSFFRIGHFKNVHFQNFL